MTIQLKTHLRRYRLLVVPVRATRETMRLWRRVAHGFQQEQEGQARLEQRQQLIDNYLRQHSVRKLQIGAGKNPLPGWLNTDLEPVSPAIMQLNATEPFPFADEVFDYVFSEHMIEHIPYRGALTMLGECFRILKPGGRIRIATPDITQIASLCGAVLNGEQKRYIGWSMDHLGLYAPEKSEFQKRRPEWALDVHHLRQFFPRKDEDPACFVVNNFFRSYGHQFLYDFRTLRAAMQATGFADVQQFRPGQSDDPVFCGVETHGRHIGDAINDFETMVLEAVRPLQNQSP